VITIRLATESDLAAINAIYNHYVLTSTCTYQEEPDAPEARVAWFRAHGAEHPVTVAVDAGGEVLGWGALSRFHPRSAYRRTVENAVYVRPDHHRRGIGRLLLSDQIDRARAAGHHAILALVDSDQPASIALHEALGFERVAFLREVGYKFGRWLHVVYMQRLL
jgi:phosphinothricin acetyltransferase